MADEPIHMTFLDGGLRAMHPMSDGERSAIAVRARAKRKAEASLVARLAADAAERVRETED